MAKKTRKRFNVFFMILVLSIIGLFLWDYRSSWIAGSLSFETVHQGLVQHEKTVKAVFANTETVLTAPAEGTVVLVGEEGKRFKKGESVARVIPAGVGHEQSDSGIWISAPVSGLFYSQRDGLEQIMTPENLMNMDLDRLLAQTQNNGTETEQTETAQENTKENSQPADNSQNTIVSLHSPIGKMVNNLYPSWVFVYLGIQDSLAVGDVVAFVIDDEEYYGTVMKLSAQPGGAVIRFSQYVQGTEENRIREIAWRFKSPTKGLVVPASALCTSGEEKGVYVLEDGVIRYQGVIVKDSNENLVCVEGLPEGVQVVVNPREGIEGMYVKS
ncbi:HlyD family efflux transporter periplasmic adaptor subunit [Dehalobacter sp. TBBPA1]|uniref:HlyD family efflux transporter periplasmic adaptor subunit n=1 Tax=Dehalobacter sp. TBBPA1 TaxID=3235037 RepID=UPI0034A1B9A4